GGPGSDPAARRPRMKISRRVFPRSPLDRAADSDLAFQFHPIKTKRRDRIGLEIAALLAVVIREETEAARIHALEQHDPRGWFPLGRGGGKTHGVDVANVGGERRGEPGAELLDRVRVEIGAAKTMRVVFVAQPAQFRNRRLIHNGKRGTLFEGSGKVEARLRARRAS